MNKQENLENAAKMLENIRDIILKAGLRNEYDDEKLQSICYKIGSFYAELSETLNKRDN